MSDYGAYDGPRRYRSTRTRPRESGDADFVEETTYVERGKGPPPRDLVFRRDRDEDVDSDRDYSPRGGGRSRYNDYRDDYNDVRRSARRARSHIEDDYDDYAGPGAAGAAAGYVASRSRRDVDRESRRDYYSDDDRSPPRKHERKKSGIEGILQGLGLGGIAGAVTGKAKERSRSRSRAGERARSDSPVDKHRKRERQWAQAAQAAIVAGAIEAYRSRKEPGPWTGGRGKRVATAAISAGGIDRLIDRDPDHKTKRHLVEAVVGGLAANRLANGPRDKGGEERGRSQSRPRSIMDRLRSKSRGRSRSDSGSRERGREKSKDGTFKNVAIGGAVAAAGKAIYDRVRSKSRQRERSRSSSSEDSYVASRRRRRDVGPYSQSRGGPDDTAVAAPLGRGQRSVTNKGDGSKAGSDELSKTDTTSSTEMENNRKKMRGKEYLTAGLASVATIHAAHSVYNTIQGSEKRHKLVQQGEMTVEEARKKRHKAWLQDAAAIGIAALGIKGAYSEWKEMNEQRHEIKELEERRRKRAKRRAAREKEAQMGRMHLVQNGIPPGGGYPGPGGLPPPPMGH